MAPILRLERDTFEGVPLEDFLKNLCKGIGYAMDMGGQTEDEQKSSPIVPLTSVVPETKSQCEKDDEPIGDSHADELPIDLRDL